MDSKTVRYGRIGEVVVLIFPDEAGSKHFITQIETQNLLSKMGMDKIPVPLTGTLGRTVNKRLEPRVVA